jgi:hypothetical protein
LKTATGVCSESVFVLLILISLSLTLIVYDESLSLLLAHQVESMISAKTMSPTTMIQSTVPALIHCANNNNNSFDLPTNKTREMCVKAARLELHGHKWYWGQVDEYLNLSKKVSRVWWVHRLTLHG